MITTQLWSARVGKAGSPPALFSRAVWTLSALLFSPQVAPAAQRNLHRLPRASDGPCRSGLRRAAHYWVKTIASCRRWPRSPIRRISLQTNCVMGIHASLQSSRMAQRGRRSLMLESFRRARAEQLVGRSRSKRVPIHNLRSVTRRSNRRIIWCRSLSLIAEIGTHPR